MSSSTTIAVFGAIALGSFAAAGASGSAAAFALGLQGLATASAWWLASTDVGRPARGGGARLESLYWSHVVALLLFALASGITIAQAFGRLSETGGIEKLSDLHPLLAVPLAISALCALAAPASSSGKCRRETWGMVAASIIALVGLHLAAGETIPSAQTSADAGAAGAIGLVMAILAGSTALDLRRSFTAADEMAGRSDAESETAPAPMAAQASTAREVAAAGRKRGAGGL